MAGISVSNFLVDSRLQSPLDQRLSTSGPPAKGKATFLVFDDINTQTDQIWQFSMAQLSVVVCDQETKFVSGPRVSKGFNRWSRLPAGQFVMEDC